MGWQGNAPVCRRRLDHLAAYPCSLVLFGAVSRSSWMERWMDENDAESLRDICGGIALCLWLQAACRASSDRLCVHGNAPHSLISVTTPAAMVEPTYLSMKRPSSL